MDTRKRDARVAGVLYLLMAVSSVLGLTIPAGFTVHGDAMGTAQKIASSQLFYRACVVSDLASQVLFVFLALALYRLLAPVDKRQAALMVALVLVQVPMAFANTLLGMAPLVLLDGGIHWAAFDRHQLAELSMGVLRLRAFGIDAIKILWGLWLLPFGILVFRSRFIPRPFGVLLVVGCVAYVIASMVALLFPTQAALANRLMVLGVGEVLIILWLVIAGARREPVLGV